MVISKWKWLINQPCTVFPNFLLVWLDHFWIRPIAGMQGRKFLPIVLLCFGILATFCDELAFSENLKSLKKGVIKVKGKLQDNSDFIINIFTFTSMNQSGVTKSVPLTADKSSPAPSPKNPVPMILISSGEFWMGSPEDEGDADEHPRNKVYLDAFYVDIYEVTVSHYAKFMKATRRNVPEFWDQVDLRRDSEKPVVGISWYDARDYCEWSGKRLPTEAEWERTARGTEGRKYPWGSNPPSPNLANFDQNFRTEKAYADYLKPVGAYKNSRTPEGAYDMTGNVWEWVNDWYEENYYKHIPTRNPLGPDRGETKVMRGGSWDYYPWILRSADRNGLNPSDRYATLGFRCAREAEKP